MDKSFVKCPKDPKNQYYKKVCLEVFRKGNIRNWCKSCEIFQQPKKDGEK